MGVEQITTNNGTGDELVTGNTGDAQPTTQCRLVCAICDLGDGGPYNCVPESTAGIKGNTRERKCPHELF